MLKYLKGLIMTGLNYGGVVFNKKGRPEEREIIKSYIPAVVKVPVQSIFPGKPSDIIVNPGQDIVEGDIIAGKPGTGQVSFHASVSGKVTAIERINFSNGGSFSAVVIKTGGVVKNWYSSKTDYRDFSPSDIIKKIEKAGITCIDGLGGPLDAKLHSALEKKVSTVILNLIENDPYINSVYAIGYDKTKEVIEGLRIIMKTLKAREGIITLNSEKKVKPVKDAPVKIKLPEVIEKSIEGMNDIRAVFFRSIYPLENERLLVRAVSGAETASGKDVSDSGYFVLNAADAYAVFEAVVYGKPLIERIITYKADSVVNAKVRIGTPASALIEEFGNSNDKGTIINDGPLTGYEINRPDFPVMKNARGIAVLPGKADYKIRMKPCIRCSNCLSSCPVRLNPVKIYNHIISLKTEQSIKSGLKDCIECGICSYVCPSFIPLSAVIRHGKS